MPSVPLYKPPTRVTTREYTWLGQVIAADPEWSRYRHRELQYEMTRRIWVCDTDVDGPYSPYAQLWQQGVPNTLPVTGAGLLNDTTGAPLLNDTTGQPLVAG